MYSGVSKLVRWEDWNLPWKDKKKEKLVVKPYRSSGKQSNKDWQQQSEQVIRKNPEQSRRKFHHVLLTCTLLLPGAVQSWSAPSCLPQTRMIRGNLMCEVPVNLGATWRLMSVPLNSKLELKSSWNAYCSCRGTIYIYIYIYMFVCMYIYTYIHTYGVKDKGIRVKT